MNDRDGHVHVLPLHVANKIAAGEVVERPASVVKELVENALDAGARQIRITLTAGGRKLIAVQDDGCGMTREDALLSLERQATSKIRDVNDIEEIDTLGFRGEAIPSIASVSRFTLTTRRAEADEATTIVVNAGICAEVKTAGAPPGTIVEVRDLFCNVPARRKFLRAYTTEESHVRTVFTVHALAHPTVGFVLNSDGRELYRLAPAATLAERVHDLFGDEFLENLLPLQSEVSDIQISGYIERPNLATPTRRDQYIFVNGRPATAPSLAYALREAFPRQAGDVRPATILFVTLPPSAVDVNVHPTKREVRFRDNAAVKAAVTKALTFALSSVASTPPSAMPLAAPPPAPEAAPTVPSVSTSSGTAPATAVPPRPTSRPIFHTDPTPAPTAVPTQIEFAIDPASTSSKPWAWFRILAITASGYILIETDAGVVTLNPHAARERIAFEQLMRRKDPTAAPVSQTLLIPETVRLTPTEAARVQAALTDISALGFHIEPFGSDTFKIDAVPQILGSLSPAAVLATIARDLSENSSRRSGERWREELIAKSVSRSFAGSPLTLNEEVARKLVEDLATCQMPYVCPRGKVIMIFTSTRELDRKFSRD